MKRGDFYKRMTLYILRYRLVVCVQPTKSHLGNRKKNKTRGMKDVHRVVTGCELYVLLFVAVRALLLYRLEVKPK